MAPSPPPLKPPFDAASLSEVLHRIQSEYLSNLRPLSGIDPRAFVATALGVDPVLMNFPRLRRLINLLFVLCPHPISFDFVEIQSALDAQLPPRVLEALKVWRTSMGFWSITRTDNNRFQFKNLDQFGEPSARSKDLITYQLLDFYLEPWTGNVALGWMLPIRLDSEDPQNTVFTVGFVPDAVCLKQIQLKIRSGWNEKFHTLLDPLCRYPAPISHASRALETPIKPDPSLLQTVVEALQRRDQMNGKLREKIARAVTPAGVEEVAAIVRSVRHQVLSGLVKYNGRLLSHVSPNAEALAPVEALLRRFGLLLDGSMPALDQKSPLRAQDILLLGSPPPEVRSSLPPNPSIADVVASRLWSEVVHGYLTERRWLATWNLLPTEGRLTEPLMPPSGLSYDTLWAAFLNIFSPDILETPLTAFLEPRLLALLSSQLGKDPLLLKHLPKTEANLLKLRGLGASRLSVVLSALLALALSWRHDRIPRLRQSLQTSQKHVQAHATAQSALAEIQSLLGL